MNQQEAPPSFHDATQAFAAFADGPHPHDPYHVWMNAVDWARKAVAEQQEADRQHIERLERAIEYAISLADMGENGDNAVDGLRAALHPLSPQEDTRG